MFPWGCVGHVYVYMLLYWFEENSKNKYSFSKLKKRFKKLIHDLQDIVKIKYMT